MTDSLAAIVPALAGLLRRRCLTEPGDPAFGFRMAHDLAEAGARVELPGMATAGLSASYRTDDALIPETFALGQQAACVLLREQITDGEPA
jgi:hypothetical protein